MFTVAKDRAYRKMAECGVIRVLRRLNKEYSLLLKNPVEGISAGPRLGQSLFPQWDAYIHGPEGTPYEGGIFKLQVEFTNSYPFKPPKVQFVTRILHCNIDHLGRVNVDILHNCWSPALTVEKVLLCIRSVLTDPNPDDPLDFELGALLKRDPKEYDRVVREATLQYATPCMDSGSDDDT